MSQFNCNICVTDVYFRCVNPEVPRLPASYCLEVAQLEQDALNFERSKLDLPQLIGNETLLLDGVEYHASSLPFDLREVTTFTHHVEILKDGKVIFRSPTRINHSPSDIYH